MQKTTYFAHIEMQSGTITRKIGSESTTNAVSHKQCKF